MKRIILVATTVFFSSPIWAGVYLEPYVGYEMGTFKGDVTIGGVKAKVDEKDTGVGIGAKIGYSVAMAAFGVDYMSVNLTGKDQQTPPSVDSKWKGSDVGAFAQFSVPKLVKLSATYIAASKIKDDTVAKGKGFKVGVGLIMFPLISINVDMISIKYDDITVPGVTIDSSDVKLSTIMVGVSLPFDLM